MINKKFISSILALTASSQLVQAAYNPYKPEAIKLTNTALANFNAAAVTEFNNFNTTAVVNTDQGADVFTSVTTNGVVCIPGTYLVDAMIYHTGTITRGNVQIEITVDGTSTGTTGAGGYIRNGGGHNESSTSVSDTVTITSSSKIGFEYQRVANAGTIPVPVGQSSFRIVRIKD